MILRTNHFKKEEVPACATKQAPAGRRQYSRCLRPVLSAGLAEGGSLSDLREMCQRQGLARFARSNQMVERILK
jgi:hypothetical protein